MRSRSLSLTVFSALAARCFAAPPTINAVANNYSYIYQGLPNYGIAQGSIFVIFGSNLAAVNSGLQGLPLNTTLDGVSVQISVGGVSTQALLYYVMPNQLAGVLPSATPVGTGQIVVTANGQASAPAPITVVQAAFGIVEVTAFNTRGAGAFDVAGKALGSANAANRGDTIEFYGSGAGPVSGDESIQQIPQDLVNIPIEVDIGGIPATVKYHGRSIYPGLDQINVVIPAGVAGCNVSLAVVTGGLVSNVALLPVAEQGRFCSDQVPGVILPPQGMVSGKSVANYGLINLTRSVAPLPANFAVGNPSAPNFTTDMGNATFQRVTSSQPVNVIFGDINAPFPSIGNCLANTIQTPLQGAASSSISAPTTSQLNGGPAINFSGPNGKASAVLEAGGFYSGLLGGGPVHPLPLFIPDGGGAFAIDNGSGGPDVGPFAAQFNVAPPLVWSNMPTIPSAIDRSMGVTLTWTGGNPSGLVNISATSATTTATEELIVLVNCTAPVAAGQFTIPSSALLALPPGSLMAALSLQAIDSFPFSAPGLDAGLIEATTQYTINFPYQ